MRQESVTKVTSLPLAVLLFLSVLSTQAAHATPCNLNGRYLSTQLLSTLLAGSPALTVTSESAELTLQRGSINIAAEANISSNAGGSVVFTGDGVLKGSARYRVTSRGNRNYLALSNIRRDLFTVRTFINGQLSSEREMRGVAFGDREIQFRCRGRQLDLFYDVNGESKRVRYTRR